MQTHPNTTQTVDSSPRGEHIAAFFSLDQTLLAGDVDRAFTEKVNGLGEINADGLKGRSNQELVELGWELFENDIHRHIYPEARALVEAHQRLGHKVCIVSSASDYQAAPIANSLGVEHVLCTQYELEEGVLTGELKGIDKMAVVASFANEHGVKLDSSFYYTNTAQDLPQLERVGNPCPINPDKTLSQLARKRQWLVRYFNSRGRFSIVSLIRTGVAYVAMMLATALYVPVYVLSGSKQKARNATIAAWGDLGTLAVGLKLKVNGAEYLQSHRPAVFLFNHQSGVDALIACKLLRRDFTSVGKQEVKKHPLYGPFFTAIGMTFIDRFDRNKAVEQMAPVVAALESGTSLLVAPEGTRTVSKRVNPFKKGPFHLAMQAGVPIVPVILHNAIDSMPKHEQLMRAATIYVDVLPPIETSDWSVETLNQHVLDIRQKYMDTLGVAESTVTRYAAQSKKTY